MNDDKIHRLDTIAGDIRNDIIHMTYRAGKNGAHIGGGLSMVEILTVLYFDTINIDFKNPEKEDRDVFILSKGHGAIALYATLKQVGFLSQADINNFKGKDSPFWTHPLKNPKYGIEISSGSLGQGLSYAAGLALAFKMKGKKSRIYVYLGDGECDEGAVWEAASFASHHKLDNLTVIIDENKIQLDDRTENIVNKDRLSERWNAFGFSTVSADGHNIADLSNKLKTRAIEKPVAVIARTVKGKGVSFIENRPEWHLNVLTEEQYKTALKEQE